ncbi:hypothetical protein BF2512_12 [Dickeya phage BF25/12]|uniref:Uncharacterized protein n=1 Tax=Dickeya phage BF25/12 TaxID=1698708 RepID=A0A219MHL4_9CAUD|nr:hypothetical protein HOR10_gp12 [Dickeya phage BF25/12]ALA46469.1 hypothetical protein BF2512_12 [Dickeya phage BF25/12]
MPFVSFKNRKQRRSDAAEMRSKRRPFAAQKSLTRPSRQVIITDGMLKLSNFYFITLGLRVL